MPSSDGGNCTRASGHDYRRVFVRDLNPEHDQGEVVMAVCCCYCGRSPLHALTRGIKVNSTPTKDWPEEQIITGYFWDQFEGPSVEWVSREQWNREHPQQQR